MAAATSPPRLIRFDGLEVDLRAGELRKNGEKIKLQEQPLQILTMLLERPGEVVTREEIRKKLWPDDTIVEFDHSINAAIQRLRQELGDSADHPRFVETMARRGYRFIAPVEVGAIHESPPRKWRAVMAAASAIIAIAAALLALNVAGLRDRILGRAPTPKIESIAVLPLENLSGDPEQEYFADGMTEALITQLGQIRALRVISRTSVMQYKEKRKPLPEIARELNVDAVVEGSAQRVGQQAGITVRLVHASTEKQLWSQGYQRDLSNLLVLQSELARAIAQEIEVRLTPQEQTRLASTRLVNPAAHEAHLKGRYYLEQWTPEGTQLAREYFQRAIELDPDYALAYAGLAETYLLHEEEGLPPNKAMPIARELVTKALALDDTLGEAHAALAQIKLIHEWDWPGAEAEFKRALALNPSYAEGHHMYSHYLLTMGRFEESLIESQRAVEADPLSPMMNLHLGCHYLIVRQFDQAIEQYRKVLQSDPDNNYVHWHLGIAYWGKGMQKEAIAQLEEGVALARRPWAIAWLGHYYAQAGRTREAESLLEELKAESRKGYVPAHFVALVYAGLGRSEQALEWLKRAYRERDILLYTLNWGTWFDTLGPDPRFQDLLRRMNFPE